MEIFEHPFQENPEEMFCLQLHPSAIPIERRLTLSLVAIQFVCDKWCHYHSITTNTTNFVKSEFTMVDTEVIL